MKKRRVTKSLVSGAGVLLGMLCGLGATTNDAPRDAFGRPTADRHGPVHYRGVGQGTRASAADGAPRASSATAALRARFPGSGSAPASYHLDPYSAHPIGSWPEAVAIGDVTGDGRADVVITTTFYFDPDNDFSLFVFPQQSDGTLGAPAKLPYLAEAGRTGIVLADLDENGVLDVVVGHTTGITVFLAEGSGGLAPGTVTNDLDADTLTATDVDRDGHVDLISLGWSRGATIFYGDGSGAFPRRLPLETNASGYNDHEVADLNGDTVVDLAVMSGQLYATPNLSVHRHDGVGGFSAPPDTYFMGENELTGGIGLGDVTGDGLNDAVLSRPWNSPTSLWIMTQSDSGTLTGPTQIPSYDIPGPVEVADLNGDGRKDVAVLHGGWLKLGVYLQQPAGGLGPEVLYFLPYATSYSPQGIAVGDFSSDGCPDVAVADYNNGLVVLYGRGCFTPCTPDQCDDANVCTADSCDEASGCVHSPVNNGRTTCGVGACTRSVDDCIDGEPQACVPGQPAPEVCNGIDDDCDGSTDEGTWIRFGRRRVTCRLD